MEQLPEAETPHSDTQANRHHPFYEPEYRALRETITEYERASAEERIAAQVTRQKFDAMVACWRDFLHSLLKQVGPIDLKALHELINTMDNFLNRSGGKRR